MDQTFQKPGVLGTRSGTAVLLAEPEFVHALQQREMLVERWINRFRAAYLALFTAVDTLVLFRQDTLTLPVGASVIALLMVFAGFVYLIDRCCRPPQYRPWVKYVSVSFEYVMFTGVIVGYYGREEFEHFNSQGWIILLTANFMLVNFLSALRHGRAVIAYSTLLTLAANSVLLRLGEVAADLSAYVLILSVVSGLLSLLVSQSLSALFVRFRQRDRLRRFLSRDVVRKLDDGQITLALGGQSLEVTILISDLRGFTRLSEGKDPQFVVAALNTYLTTMTEVIFKHGGTIDKFLGDGILAVFGAPLAQSDHARAGLLAAMEMQQRLAELNTRLGSGDLGPLRMGIGLHSGLVVAGNIGSTERMEYTVIGDTVNLAARIESLTKEYQQAILFSESLCAALPAGTAASFVTETAVRGRQGLVRLYAIEGSAGAG